jgi:hypothetical protein
MKKSIKRGVFISIPLFAFLFIYYFLFDCRYYIHYIRGGGRYDQIWPTVYCYQEAIKDSVIDWEPLMKKDSSIKIISINNKKDSLEFFIIEKRRKKYFIRYYVNNKLYVYRSFTGGKWYYE